VCEDVALFYAIVVVI